MVAHGFEDSTLYSITAQIAVMRYDNLNLPFQGTLIESLKNGNYSVKTVFPLPHYPSAARNAISLNTFLG